jgi:hypothetical protein
MSKAAYRAVTFSAEGAAVVRTAEQILGEYSAAGYEMTLRGLYYQLVRRDLFPPRRRFWWDTAGRQFVRDPDGSNPDSTPNAQPNYKWLVSLMTDARDGGLIDWGHLQDNERSLRGGDWGDFSPEDAMANLAAGYRLTHWEGQPEMVEVWVEKQALANVVSRACGRWDVPFMACKGYMSASEMHAAARRLARYERAGQATTVLHLGDHDPSGVDMSRDIADRLALYGSSARVERIALNRDQITDDLPPAPAKITDSRAAPYIAEYGEDSWELDAMEPAVMDALIERHILAHLDQPMYAARVHREESEREGLEAISVNWDLVLANLRAEGLLNGDGEEDS